MTAKEFCYWLQGYFELGGMNHAINSMDIATVSTIKRHLALVAEVDKDHANSFVYWLGARLDAVDTSRPYINGDDSCAVTLDTSDVAKIRRLLDAQFKHVTDLISDSRVVSLALPCD